ncbi:substrate-binding domain-containing protein [Lichenihabitans sp. Uapishka_5]|uniref:substrate-binding domain-containing protein n=1 Tax=Lichenihabitans sp. Uapishka_5 TaxID=3037302 RepID=UPI0029E7F815|nr:substrate-binding domain-containing protein [Lichenihabitans sp. Uapishka_5]MDX7952108.1 substrate-binding domain-containing protein [Lichenihabitans sp. Uapishka_5]
MQPTHVAASLLVLGLAAAPSAFAAGGADQATLIHPVTKQTIVFIPKVIHPWYEVVKAGSMFAADEFKKSGIDVDVQWDQPPQADVSDHNQRIETNIGKHPDGLVVSCLDPATNVQILDEAVKAGINVETFNSFCAERFPFVGQKDSYQDGYDLAEFLAKQIGDKGNVGILSGSLTAQDHIRRVQGFKAALAKHPNIKIVFEQPDNDDLDKAVQLTENALQAHPDLVGLFGCNASNPIGAARAVQNAGKAGVVKIVGLDDLPETIQFIKDGVITATMAQRQWDQGYWAVKYIVAKNQGHTIPMDHETGSRMITKADLTN